MASDVKVTLSGDSSSLEKSFDKVGKGAKDMASDLDQAGGDVKRFGKSVDTMNAGVDASESKFMGAADLLDGLGGAFGLPTEGITNMARSFGDLAGGFSSVIAPVFSKIIGMLGFQTAATTAQASATGAATGAQWSLNAAMEANPIGLVVAAIVALIAVGVLLYKNWDTIKEFAGKAFGAVMDVISGVFDWVKDHWPLLLAIITGPIGLAVLAVVTHWDTIKNAVIGVFDWVKDNWHLLLAIITGPIGLAVGAISGKVDEIVGFFRDLPGRLANAAKGMFDWFTDMFKAAFNAMVALWNSIDFRLPEIDLPGPLGKIGGQTIGLPDLPRFHSGGVVPGRAGADVPIMAQAGETVLPRGGGEVIQLVVDGRVLAEVVRDRLLQKQRTTPLGFVT